MTSIQANLGKAFEMDLERTHQFYQVKKLASIDRNPVEWRYTSPQTYNKYANSRGMDRLVARTASGSHLIKAASDIDYSGVAKGRAVAFDAKETSTKNFPLGNVELHQVNALLNKARCGSIAGLMIRFTSVKRVYFVPVAVVDEAIIKMQFHGGRKSLSLAECAGLGLEIPVSQNLIDWLPVLLKDDQKS